MNADDGACCAEIAVATRQHLREHALYIPGQFAICVIREDGGKVDLETQTLGAVARLIAELAPRIVHLSVGADEDYAGMLAAITTRCLH